MRIKVFTLFPEMLRPVLSQSILGRAIAAGLHHVGQLAQVAPVVGDAPQAVQVGDEVAVRVQRHGVGPVDVQPRAPQLLRGVPVRCALDVHEYRVGGEPVHGDVQRRVAAIPFDVDGFQPLEALRVAGAGPHLDLAPHALGLGDLADHQVF